MPKTDRNAKRNRRRKRSGLIEITNGLLTLVVLGLLALGAGILFMAQQFYTAGPAAGETIFVVEKGSSLGTVAERLENQGLIGNRLIFQMGGLAMGKQREIKAGEFLLPPGASMSAVLKELTEGTPIARRVTIPEGWTSWQVAQEIGRDAHILTGELAGPPPEGSILPGSYDYAREDSRQSVLDQMQAKMKAALAEVWAGCSPQVCGADAPIKTPQELVTLASMIERETGVPAERGQVAAVFINRLKKGMRLQSDPTILYGITRGETSLGRGLKKSEIEAKTPYNTYQVDGLPVGPIANPGIESLKAAANPDDVDYLYFVAAGASPADGHLFASNYKDHRANVAKYREVERQQAIAAEAEADAAKDAIEAEQASEAGETVTETTTAPQ